MNAALITRIPKLDHLPEHYPYHDTGCRLQPSCLACTLPRCADDITPEEHQAGRDARDTAIARDYRAQAARGAINIPALADRYGVSRRTVHRAVRSGHLTGTLQKGKHYV